MRASRVRLQILETKLMFTPNIEITLQSELLVHGIILLKI